MPSDAELLEAARLMLGWKHLGAVGVPRERSAETDPSGLFCLSGGNDWWKNDEGQTVCGVCENLPDPIHLDRWAFKLVTKLRLHVCPERNSWRVWPCDDDPDSGLEASNQYLNRAICECAWNIWMSEGDQG